MLEYLAHAGPVTWETLVARYDANAGHLAAAVRLLTSLDWLEETADGLILLPRAEERTKIPAGIAELLAVPPMDGLRDPAALGLLGHWLPAVTARWHGAEAFLAEMLDGLVFGPMLIALSGHGAAMGIVDWSRLPLTGLSHDAVAVVDQLWRSAGWGGCEGETLRSDAVGASMLERGLNLATTLSYRRMLAQVDALLFGDAPAAMAAVGGIETHVDRGLNVTGSGFQHHRFFADLVALLHARFDGSQPDEEPEVVVDMGAGDGSLLLAIHDAAHAVPGRDRAWPVMVAADLNAAALAEAGATLSRRDVPHRLVEANIDRPAELMERLGAIGLGGRRTLHVRSFLDHDRQWRPPLDAAAAARRRRHGLRGVYAAPDGGEIDPADAVQALVEHLGAWSDTVGEGGLAIAEVHALPAATVAGHLDDCENLHFDAYHALSGQHLVEADTFLLAMAEVGLFPRAGSLVRYPRSLPFTRITLAWYEKRGYRVRLAEPADLESLLALDEAGWVPALRFGRDRILALLSDHPGSVIVADVAGTVAAAVYIGRLPAPGAVHGRTLDEFLAAPLAEGPVVQLMGAVVLPDAPAGLGGLLLDFVLDWASCKPGVTTIVGVTRFGDYPARPDLEPADYLRLSDPGGLPIDPILRFHAQRGARIEGLVPGFRPTDADNRGFGVLISYARRGDLRVAGRDDTKAAAGEALDVATVVHGTIKALLRPDHAEAFAPDRPLRELGLDSLDLQELRQLLATRLGRPIDPGFLFRFPSADAITRALTTSEPAKAPQTPTAPAVGRPYLPATSTGWQPIAIIGHAGRFPGAADPEALWRNLIDGTDAIRPVPSWRWDAATLTADEPGTPGLMNSAEGGFIDGIDLFDAGFFHLSRREAARLDPQQRLLLEASWQAFERAGIDPKRLTGSLTGVYVGQFSHDYEVLQAKDIQAIRLSMAYSLGGSAAGASGRLAYFYGFQGPAIAIDTACSSSLVTIHTACRALQAGDINLAVCGGVSAVLSPELSIAFSQAGILSADARCRTLDAAASGYGRAEGCGVVLLKRLDDALAEGDRIEAVVLGGALGQDGASNGFAAPNGAAQEALIRRALEVAGVGPDEIDMVEMHGTGTAVGDVVEAGALAQVFAGRQRPLVLGAVKSAVGHMEAAAGVTGVIKLLQSFRHGAIPPNQHYTVPAAGFDPAAIPSIVPTAPMSWPSSRPVAGISAFGYSGTLAHLVLSAPEPAADAPVDRRDHHVYALSAPTPTALADLALQHADAIEALDAPLADAAHTVTTGRAHFRHRLAIAARTKATVVDALRRYAAGDTGGVEAGAAATPEGVALLFSGQGGHHPAMAAAQFEAAPAFRAVIERCEAPVREVLGRSLTAALYGDDPTALELLAQPAIYAVQAGLSALLHAWGVKPTIVLGHSLGEFAAAETAGIFSLEDGARLVAHRARLVATAPGDGAMAAIEASAEQLAPLLAASTVAVAAYNAPNQTVVSGPTEDVLALIATAKAGGLRCHRLPVAHAFHSALMEPILAEFAAAAGAATLAPPTITYISSLEAAVANEAVATPDYWARHLRHPARFNSAARVLSEMAPGLAVECAPVPMLASMVAAGGLALDVYPALGLADGPWAGLMAILARAYAGGAAIDWSAVDDGLRRPRVLLPTYPFERRRHWFSDGAASARRSEAVADA
ncbi:type I polyketide synthase [Azospirillum sp. B4]|uniref:type I polyketide synthase n=1 Tax=Azospirillum sp. B4 TaxID=95605 RepID=UPI000346B3F7|nr:type I polyketide synthase [Azospirillum sp. B4]